MGIFAKFVLFVTAFMIGGAAIYFTNSYGPIYDKTEYSRPKPWVIFQFLSSIFPQILFDIEHVMRNPIDLVLQDSSSFLLLPSLATLIKHNIPDLLFERDLYVAELAKMSHFHEETLLKMLRFVTTKGYFREKGGTDTKLFGNTPLTDVLRKRHLFSIRNTILLKEKIFTTAVIGNFEDLVTNGPLSQQKSFSLSSSFIELMKKSRKEMNRLGWEAVKSDYNLTTCVDISAINRSSIESHGWNSISNENCVYFMNPIDLPLWKTDDLKKLIKKVTSLSKKGKIVIIQPTVSSSSIFGGGFASTSNIADNLAYFAAWNGKLRTLQEYDLEVSKILGLLPENSVKLFKTRSLFEVIEISIHNPSAVFTVAS